MNKNNRHWNALALGLLLLMLAGCASVPLEEQDPRDPFQRFNRAMYTFNDGLDTTVLKPAAEIYQGVMPTAVNRAVTNFFGNLTDVIVAVNDLLQGKIRDAAEDTMRVVYNTTFGVLGLFDVARYMDLPKRDEDFGQTLGVWGVKSGPYLVLPFFGPSSGRDTVGLVADRFTHPLGLVTPESDQLMLYGLNVVDTRADLLRAERALAGAALDPYVFLREAYLQRRQRLVYDGNPPLDLDDE